MLRLLVSVCLVALCAAWSHGNGKMKKYAHGKILSSCFGEEYLTGMYERMGASSKKCSTQPQLIETNDLDFQDVIDEIRNMALPWGSRPDDQHFQLLSAGGRSKRHVSDKKHAHTTAEKLYHFKEKMACMIGNMTCMLRDLDWMKEDKTPNISQYEKEISDWASSPAGTKEMKDELMWGLDVCKDFSMCISPQRAKSPFMKELGHYISFQKCIEMKNVMACMKTDYKKYAVKEGYPEDVVNEVIDSGLHGAMKHNKKENMGVDALTATMSGDLIF